MDFALTQEQERIQGGKICQRFQRPGGARQKATERKIRGILDQGVIFLRLHDGFFDELIAVDIIPQPVPGPFVGFVVDDFHRRG